MASLREQYAEEWRTWIKSAPGLGGLLILVAPVVWGWVTRRGKRGNSGGRSSGARNS